MSFESVLPVSNAVLYEGYSLYPYRASAVKNQQRWQFGVVAPRPYCEATGLDRWQMQTECLLEPIGARNLQVRLRFLQLEAKQPLNRSAGRDENPPWDEGIEQDFEVEMPLSRLVEAPQQFSVYRASRTESVVQESVGTSEDLVLRQRWAIDGCLTVTAVRLQAASDLIKVTARIENLAPWGDAASTREEALRRSFLSLQTLLCAPGGEFVSLTDPPEWARYHVDDCENISTWPVLAGEGSRRDTMLSSPIILYDYPQVAPESPGDLFDGTEIDEILSLRTMTLTDDEKQEAREADPRVASMLDRVDSLPPELMDRLHGAIRYLRNVTGESESRPNESTDPRQEEAPRQVLVDGVTVGPGARLRVRPTLRGTDAQDLFLEGREVLIEKVMQDADGRIYLVASLPDDPGSDINTAHGRFLYFDVDELQPVEATL